MGKIHVGEAFYEAVQELPQWQQKIIGILIVVLMIAAVIAYAIFFSVQKSQLIGTWIRNEPYSTDEQVDMLLEQGFTMDEIDCLPTMQMTKVISWEFQKSGQYYYGYNQELSMSSMMTFYECFFENLYLNRATLCKDNSLLHDDMTEDEFYQYYATKYGCEAYEDLIVYLAETAVDYTSSFLQLTIHGTYTASGRSQEYSHMHGGYYKYAKISMDGVFTKVYYWIENGIMEVSYGGDVAEYALYA